MKLSRAERARLIEIDRWLVAEQLSMQQVEQELQRLLKLFPKNTLTGVGLLDNALDRVRLPLGHLKWLLALVKREASR